MMGLLTFLIELLLASAFFVALAMMVLLIGLITGTV